jgi:ribosomal protein S18 acetylase RimI-like enzyme
MQIETRRAGIDEARLLAAVAARSFWDDPLFNHFFPDLFAQHRHAPGFFLATIDDCARHGEVWCATNGDTNAPGTVPVGIAAWLPPGVGPAVKGRRALRQTRLAAPSMLRSPRRRPAFALLNAVVAQHLHDEHWYLALLAADPSAQGRGVGTALLTPMLERADSAGLPVYLETQKEANLAYYRRHGFEVGPIVQVPGSPPVWTMTRAAR